MKKIKLMFKVEEAANKIVQSDFKLVKIKKNDKFIYNKLKNSNITNEKRLEEYKQSYDFEKLVRTDAQIFKHPTYAEKKGETANTIIYKVVTITHSPKYIRINDQKVEKIKVSSYVKDGKQIGQYATNASWLIEVDKKEPNFTIEDVSNETEEIKKLGGKENIKKIKEKLENEWNTKPTYEYIDYLKKIVIHDIEKYKKDLELAQENENKPNTEE